MDTRSRPLRACLIALLFAALASGCDRRDPAVAVRNDTEAQAAIKRYCSECHNDIDLMGGLSFHDLDAANVGTDAETWERIVRKLRTRTMPPQDAVRPKPDTYDTLAVWLETALDKSGNVHPGPPALRRLNRAEYANAIRDLLDLDVDAKTLLPPDDSAFGFDNNGDLLVFSPALLERYLTAADFVSALAVGDPATAVGAKTYDISGDQSQAQHRDGLPLGTVGGFAIEHTFPLDAEYDFAITLFRNNLEVIRGLEYPHRLEIAVDGERVFTEEVGGSADAPPPAEEGGTVTERSDAIDARLRVRLPVKAGPREVTVAFIRKMGVSSNRLRPFQRSNAGTYDSTGRPHVETLTITGPFDQTAAGDTPSRRRIFSCTPADTSDERRCAEEILSALARRAYRGPVSEPDLARLMPFFEQGRAKGGFETGIQLALRRILASPSFAFRVEADPVGVAAGEAYPVSDVEFATRLSFFLWSSIPDDELLAVAESGKLEDPDVLEAQVRRMLRDPKAQALPENFAGQWLHLRNLDNIRPNSDEFPDFDNNLRQAFRREAELFFASILNEDRSVLDLMTADYTYVDERLARHYGIPNVYGSRFRRVELGPDLAARAGLLGKGGVLMATSHADRTAPSLRGKWLLENLMGSPPPAPPANVPPLEIEPGAAPKTMRERMESHRANPSCAGCHQLIDPLGFAMENFDAVGGWRTRDAGRDVDARGVLADGTAVDGALDLRAALLRDPRVFVGTFTEKMLTYALGRGLQHYDMPLVRKIMRDTEKDGYRSTAIVLAIINSPPFRMRVKAADGDALIATR
jgi:hypothetical protein